MAGMTVSSDVQIMIRALTGDESSVGLTRAFKEATIALQELAKAASQDSEPVCCGEGTSLFEVVALDGTAAGEWVRLCNVCREPVALP